MPRRVDFAFFVGRGSSFIILSLLEASSNIEDIPAFACVAIIVLI